MSDQSIRQPDAPPAQSRPARRDDVQEASEESFPASDAPSWAPLRVGRPREQPAAGGAREARGRPTEGDG